MIEAPYIMQEAINFTIEDLVCNESFLRYYYGTNEPDRLDWEDWQATDPGRKLLVQNAFELLDRLSLKRDSHYIQTQWAHFRPQLHPKQDFEGAEKSATRRKISYRQIAWAAAAALALLLLAFRFWRETDAQTPFLAQVIENSKPATVSIYRLPDGTLVRLKTGSSLRLSEMFDQKERRVYLSGEAYFEVAENPQKPFKVQAGNTLTTALGTVFNVRAYPGEARVKVVLISGKVKVERENREHTPLQAAILAPGQQIVAQTDALGQPAQADIAGDTRWKDGLVLTFRGTPFREVVKVLSENYRITISGYEQNPLESHEITAEFDRAAPLGQVLETLAFSNNFKFEQKVQHVQIFPGDH